MRSHTRFRRVASLVRLMQWANPMDKLLPARRGSETMKWVFMVVAAGAWLASCGSSEAPVQDQEIAFAGSPTAAAACCRRLHPRPRQRAERDRCMFQASRGIGLCRRATGGGGNGGGGAGGVGATDGGGPDAARDGGPNTGGLGGMDAAMPVDSSSVGGGGVDAAAGSGDGGSGGGGAAGVNGDAGMGGLSGAPDGGTACVANGRECDETQPSLAWNIEPGWLRVVYDGSRHGLDRHHRAAAHPRTRGAIRPGLPRPSAAIRSPG